jgi:hypothetical protein
MKKKKVLFFHGLGGCNEPELTEFMEKYNVNFFNPTMDYELNKGNKKFNDYILSLGEDYDYIVGNSMGGFWAFHVGVMCNKKTILFNPALSEITMSYNWFYKNFYKWNLELPEPLRKEVDVKLFISDKDTTVVYEETFKWLEKMGYKYSFEWMKGHSHSFPLNLMIKNIFKEIL